MTKKETDDKLRCQKKDTLLAAVVARAPKEHLDAAIESKVAHLPSQKGKG